MLQKNKVRTQDVSEEHKIILHHLPTNESTKISSIVHDDILSIKMERCIQLLVCLWPVGCSVKRCV